MADRRPDDLDHAQAARFVIHEHYARTHHFDLRLEHAGTLWSWALPKGMPTDPKENRLAVRVEDHDMDHIDFEDPTPVPGARAGIIRKSIWDRGTYRIVRATPDKLVLDLCGERLNDRYALFRTGGAHWLLHRMTTCSPDATSPLNDEDQ